MINPHSEILSENETNTAFEKLNKTCIFKQQIRTFMLQ